MDNQNNRTDNVMGARMNNKMNNVMGVADTMKNGVMGALSETKMNNVMGATENKKENVMGVADTKKNGVMGVADTGKTDVMGVSDTKQDGVMGVAQNRQDNVMGVTENKRDNVMGARTNKDVMGVKTDAKREAMLKNIKALEFYLYDLQLYLDTHPCDSQAIAYYKKYLEELKTLAQRFQEMYGPLTPYFVEDEDYWSWVENPWPWDK